MQEKGCKGQKVSLCQQLSHSCGTEVIPGYFLKLFSEGMEDDLYDKASVLLQIRSLLHSVLRKGAVLLICFCFSSVIRAEVMNACSPATLQVGVLDWLIAACVRSEQAALLCLLLDCTSNPLPGHC